MAEILFYHAESNEALRKTLMGTVGILTSDGDYEKAKQSVDYALHFPDFIRYNEHGHHLIIEEIKTVLETLVNRGETEFALKVAQYLLEKGEEVEENFEDGWSWMDSLERLKKWTETLTG